MCTCWMATRYAQMNALREWVTSRTEELKSDLLHACGVWETMPEVLTELVSIRGFEVGMLHDEEVCAGRGDMGLSL